MLNAKLIVAIKKLDPDGLQGIREFVVEVLTLSMADHPNLVKLIGYCAEGEERLLVYEYMSLGSLEDHLHGNPQISLPSPVFSSIHDQSSNGGPIASIASVVGSIKSNDTR
ncbi:hypothetical protein L6452_01408 [Arctium lappa]|uniref:Uncharacterized protein n=1 Tax=Arctium lappa TaxID=4217 RepID=A0ACB9FHG9_ARCLA|nr:hypothetical protein L6452_01408 [Arctium lappa]